MNESVRLWPAYRGPADLKAIEAVPLAERGLPDSAYAALERAAVLWRDRPALTVLPDPDRPQNGIACTFAGLLDDVNRIANLFDTHGDRFGTPVAVMAPNTHLTPALLIAAQTAGPVMPLNPRLPLEQLAHLLSLTGARILVAAGPEFGTDAWATAHTLAGRLRLDALYALRPAAPTRRPPALEALPGTEVAYLHQAASPLDRTQAPARPQPSEVASYFRTARSTGTPKLVAHTHTNQITNAWSTAVDSFLEAPSAVFAGLPLFQPNAYIVTLLAPLLRGQHVIWAGPLGYRDPGLFENFWKIVEHHRITALLTTPGAYSVLGQVALDADIDSLRIAAVTGPAMPAAARASFTARTGIEPCEGYGLAEATCLIARNFTGPDRHPSAAGQRLPYQQAKTIQIDSDGTWRDLPPGAPGTLAIHGPNVFAGYVTNPRVAGPGLLTLDTVRDGWLNTGDFGHIDSDGFIHLHSRPGAPSALRIAA